MNQIREFIKEIVDTIPQHALSPGLAIRNKRTGIEYTITGISDVNVSITSPDGQLTTISVDRLSDDFVID